MSEEAPGEVIAVYPNKIKIAVNDIDGFQSEGALLSVGSYVKVYDHQDGAIIALIENFSIEIKETTDDKRKKVYIVEAAPLGFIDHQGTFIRGGNQIAIPPKKVEAASKEDIQKIYNGVYPEARFCFAKLAQDKSVEVPVDGNKFFNKHIAIVGSTGSGKSHTLAKILQEATQAKHEGYTGLNNSHIVIFDIHSEYRNAFPEAKHITAETLVLPYWLLSSEELEDLFIESNEEQSHNQVAVLKRAITDSKRANFSGDPALRQKIHYDSPLYFDIQKVYETIVNENKKRVPGATAKTDKAGPLFGKLENFITRLENKLNDVRLDFLLGEGSKGINAEDVLRQLLSYKADNTANVTIIDLSGVPFEVLSTTVSLISRILFDYAYHSKKSHGELLNETPLLLVYEEAHKYVPKTELVKFNASRLAIERIAKEGRKYGITLAIVSQRPSEISETIFSQCSNFVAMRLTNPDDQGYVKKLLPDTLGPLTQSLPILQAGEALLIGESSVMPSLILINECTPSPSSSDIKYLDEWKKSWKDMDFKPVIDSWQK